MGCCWRTIVDQNHEPKDGLFCNVIVRDPIQKATWIYDSNGIYSEGTAGRQGLSFRHSQAALEPNSDVALSDIAGNEAQVGDLLMDNSGDVYQVVSINHGADTVTIGDLITNLGGSSIAPGNDGDFFVTLDKQTQWEPVNIIGEEI